ncbi:MAG: DNA gyrase subunit A [Candidatus Nanoarchaeia archaeon]
MDDSNLRTKDVFIEDEMKKAYLSYAMSVIVGRALPEAKDGLKPVHRRVIYSMKELGNYSNKAYKKSARIVGEVMGKYHPHGDTSIYDAMVRLAQYWSVRYQLVDGQGNFGSVDGDNPAAMRYTEARMSKLSEKFLEDIDKDTVAWRNNFDDTLQEPVVLPAKFPNLLLNGSSGIAVGMATSIPPHNLRELTDALIHIIEHPETTTEELVRKGFVKGPDFPTGATILKNKGIQDYLTTGEGAITQKAICSIEEKERGKSAIIIDEIPYQVNKLNLINNIVDLVKTGKLKDISDIRDESNKRGVRVVIEIKKEGDPNVILNQLYKFTTLQTNFNAKMLAIVDGTPQVMNLGSYLRHFIAFRKDVIIKRTQFDLKKAQDRLHILEGLTKALDNIDRVIALIKGSKSGPEAKEGLMSQFSFSDLQAQAILDMRLQKLTGLEMGKIRDEYNQTLELIRDFEDILSNEVRQYQIIKDESLEIVEKFGDDRKTKLINDTGDSNIEDLIQDEDFVVMITQNDYIKKVPLDNYRAQKRGGKGNNAHLKAEDTIRDLFVSNSKDTLLIFTSDGVVNWMKAYEVPTATGISRGRPIVNYIDLRGRKISNVINISNLEKGYLIFLTKKGIIKKTEVANFAKPRAGGIRAIGLDEGDVVLNVMYSNGDEDVIIESNVGLAIRFKQDDLSVLGRTARGVKSMNLKAGEEVAGMELAQAGTTLLTVCENGYGKRTLISEYPTIRRAGRGVIDIKADERNGKVVTLKAVREDDEILLMTQHGKIIRSYVSDISIIGRNTKGVRVVNLSEGDLVQRVEKIANEDEAVE